MLAYTIRRILMLIPVLFGISVIVFSIIRAIPGDPAEVILGEKASQEAILSFRTQLGLDNPWYIQYFKFVADLFRGNLGVSLQNNTAISQEIIPYLGATAELTCFAMLFAIIVGLNAGILSAWKQNSWFDYTAMLIALLGISMPIFWLGLTEQWYFAKVLNWLPSTGRDNPRHAVEAVTQFYLLDTIIGGNWNQFKEVVSHLILPGVALGTVPMAFIARIARASMLEVMRSDYIRTARAKGIRPFWVIYKHALKNAMIPIITVIGILTGSMLGGAVLTETIFGWPGIGRYIYSAIASRDYPVIQSGILVAATIFVMINLLVDLLYAYFDPRIKYR